MRTVSLLSIAVLSVACSAPPPERQAPLEAPLDVAAWTAETEAWRADREARLTADYGWLSVVGLDWLADGPNVVGSDPASAVVLPAEVAPARVAVLTVTDGSVRIDPEPGVALTVDDAPAAPGPVATDLDPSPDTFRIGDLQFRVLRRGERIGVRSRWPRAPRRAAFDGLTWYAPDPEWRLVARLERDTAPIEIDVPNVLGTIDRSASPGRAVFEVDGRTYALRPVHDGPDDPELFFIFRDTTAGETTYPAGRFVYATLRDDDTLVLDFNRATSPPCAFTPHATCPLPPAGNALDLAVEAGERYAGSH